LQRSTWAPSVYRSIGDVSAALSIVDVARRSVKVKVKAGEGPWGALFVPTSSGSR
jgi:hypothetical protein